MENTIFVRNLSLFGIHGKDAITKNEKREFTFDIEATISDISAAVASERLEDTFDYKYLITATEKIIDGPQCVLIETLVSRIADAVLLHDHVQQVKITLSKRELLHGAQSGITVVRVKGGQ